MWMQMPSQNQLSIVLDVKTAQFNFGDIQMFRA